MARRDLGDVAVKALTRPGIGSALLAGLGVYTVLVGQRILDIVAGVVGAVPWAQDVGASVGSVLPGALPATLIALLPFGVGVVLGFWQLAPIVPQLRMAHVVTRSLLAAVVGAVAALIAGGVVALVGGDQVQAAVAATLHLLVAGLVAVPLAALLLWGWQQSHPPKTVARGALDEV